MKAVTEVDEWWTKIDGYTPGIDKGQWSELLQNPKIFDQNSLVVMKRMLEFGGEATCKQLSEKYGEGPTFYNSISVHLAKRVYKETNCNLLLRGDSQNAKWWPILYFGRNADIDIPGTFIWHLRPELREALEEIDLSRVPLYSQDKTDKGDIKDELKAKTDGKKQYWICQPPGNSNDGLWDEVFVPEGIMCMGDDDLGDLKKFDTQEEMNNTKEQILKTIPLWQFVHEISIGDIIFVRRGSRHILAKGVVVSDYIFDDGQDEYKHIRKVKWTHNGKWKFKCHETKFLTEITNRTNYVNQLESLVLDGATPGETDIEHKAEVTSKQRYWLYEPPGSREERIWSMHFDAGTMCVPDYLYNNEPGDLARFSTQKFLTDAIDAIGLIDCEADFLWKFTHEVTAGDIVFLRLDGNPYGIINHILARGVVESAYIFDDSRNQHKHIHRVKWTHSGKWTIKNRAFSPLIDITLRTDFIHKLESLVLGDKQETTGVTNGRYWLYNSSGITFGKNWREFYNVGIMSVFAGFDELGDFKMFDTQDDIRTALYDWYEFWENYDEDDKDTENTDNYGENDNENGEDIESDDDSESDDGGIASSLWKFAHEINLGDIVFIRYAAGKILGRGVVESDYIFDDRRSEFKHFRNVKWTHVGKWKYKGAWPYYGLNNITQHTDDIARLEALVLGDAYSPEIHDKSEVNDKSEINSIEHNKCNKYSESDFLSEVFISAERYNTLRSLLLRKKNIILQGAPGVGKTYAARRLAYSIMGEKDISRAKIIQFHQSYSYEDFVMGYRPDGSGFRLAEGPFYKFCKIAKGNKDREYFFIIDEINRGNLGKIFGELLMLIEGDKRGEEYSVPLLYKDEPFFVPKNLYIIGIMNTADRSLAMIDYALRRRFAFFDMEPAFQFEGFKNYQSKLQNAKFNSLISKVELLNKVITEDASLGAGFRIGHSYFCADGVIDDAWLSSVVEYELLPLLGEYWFEEPSKVDHWKSQLRGALND